MSLDHQGHINPEREVPRTLEGVFDGFRKFGIDQVDNPEFLTQGGYEVVVSEDESVVAFYRVLSRDSDTGIAQSYEGWEFKTHETGERDLVQFSQYAKKGAIEQTIITYPLEEGMPTLLLHQEGDLNEDGHFLPRPREDSDEDGSHLGGAVAQARKQKLLSDVIDSIMGLGPTEPEKQQPKRSVLRALGERLLRVVR